MPYQICDLCRVGKLYPSIVYEGVYQGMVCSNTRCERSQSNRAMSDETRKRLAKGRAARREQESAVVQEEKLESGG